MIWLGEKIAKNLHWGSIPCPYKLIIQQFETLKVFDINSLQSLIFMYKYKNKLLPASFHDFFKNT